MTTVELKQNLIDKISKIKDKSKLSSIYEYVEQNEVFDKNGALILTSEMKKLIAISKEQYKNGQFKTNEVVMAEAELWLRERL